MNGHLALEMAIQALGLKEQGIEVGGGEVITTPFTFVSTTHSISRNNLKPVFCDIKKISGACPRWLLETKNEGAVCPILGSFGQRKTGQRIPDMVFGYYVGI